MSPPTVAAAAASGAGIHRSSMPVERLVDVDSTVRFGAARGPAAGGAIVEVSFSVVAAGKIAGSVGGATTPAGPTAAVAVAGDAVVAAGFARASAAISFVAIPGERRSTELDVMNKLAYEAGPIVKATGVHWHPWCARLASAVDSVAKTLLAA